MLYLHIYIYIIQSCVPINLLLKLLYRIMGDKHSINVEASHYMKYSIGGVNVVQCCDYNYTHVHLLCIFRFLHFVIVSMETNLKI